MQFERIDNDARVWIVMRGPDGKLMEEVDGDLVASLQAGQSYEEIADAVVFAAAAAEIAETRVW